DSVSSQARSSSIRTMGEDAFMASSTSSAASPFPLSRGGRGVVRGSGRSGAADLDLPRLKRFHLRQVHDQHAVLALRADLAAVDRFVDRKDAVEIARAILVELERAVRLARLHPRVQEQLAVLVT